MKTIEEKAQEIYLTRIGISEFSSKSYTNKQVAIIERESLKLGIKFAQRWISIKDEFPTLNTPVFVKMSYNFFLRDIPAVDCCYWNGELWVNSLRQEHSNGSVTHWRPIDIK